MEHQLFVVSGDAVEAEALARPLRDRGWAVEVETRDPADACRRAGECRPLAVVISLDFDPASACDLACALNAAAATRDIPIIFVGGSHADVDAARRVAPHARFVLAAHIAWEVKQLSMRQ